MVLELFFSTENMNKTYSLKKKKEGNFGEEENEPCI